MNTCELMPVQACGEEKARLRATIAALEQVRTDFSRNLRVVLTISFKGLGDEAASRIAALTKELNDTRASLTDQLTQLQDDYTRCCIGGRGGGEHCKAWTAVDLIIRRLKDQHGKATVLHKEQTVKFQSLIDKLRQRIEEVCQ